MATIFPIVLAKVGEFAGIGRFGGQTASTRAIIHNLKPALEWVATNARMYADFGAKSPNPTSSRPAPKGRNTLAQGAALCFRSYAHSFFRASVRLPIRSFVVSFVCAFVLPRLRSFADSFIRGFVRLRIRSFPNSFIRAFVRSPIRSFVVSFFRASVQGYIFQIMQPSAPTMP
ncbi:MAG: hypothetical protein FJZ75_09990 [Bacteroidetes bacterium]|nr:hypothetical protein [Bacteroidota bacterium]